MKIKQYVPDPIKRVLRPLVRKPSVEARVPKRGSHPKTLSIEPTNRCNLNCPFCLVGLQNTLPSTSHDLLPRGFGFMDMDMYRKIVKDAADFGIKKMQLHFQGESLLHKQFPEMVHLAKAQGMFTQAFTNGLAITPKMAQTIVESKLDVLQFSVDGASEESYQQNRVGGKFLDVREKMQLMVDTARAKRSSINLSWQFITLRNNEHEIEAAKQIAAEIGINFFQKTFAATDPELVPMNSQYQRQLQIKPCTDIYRAIFVYWNGDVVPCCYDHKGENIVGNLFQNTLEEIWNASSYIELRHRIDSAFENPDGEPQMCKSCLKWGHEPSRTSDGRATWHESSITSAEPTDVIKTTKSDFV
jgi:radical SAM protein with 4Fe4S-binding SPASM domain|tara:strand:+ start:960 stop:2033 length:1074 start_codon:yes stop_codon:yes gene_type:complete